MILLSRTTGWIECSGIYETLCLVVVHQLSEKLRNIFRRHVPQTEISMRNYKDELPLPLQSNLVYYIPCADCANHRPYIGSTSQYLKNRISQHKNSVRNLQQYLSALAHHSIQHRHLNVRVIARSNNYSK